MKKWKICGFVLPVLCAICLIVSCVFVWNDVSAVIPFWGIVFLAGALLLVSAPFGIAVLILTVGIIVLYVWGLVQEKRCGLIAMIVIMTMDTAIHIIGVVFSWWHLLAALVDVCLIIGMMLTAFHRNEF